LDTSELELKNVTLIKGGVPILDDISLTVRQGEVTAVMGPSGSGKTTLLKMIAGLMPPNRGDVLFRGKDIFSMSKKENEDFRRQSGFVFQDAALWANKSIYENLFIPVKFHYPHMNNGDIRKKILRRLEELGMADNETLRPAQLSIGEQMLIAYIRGTVNDPRILFLDSPLLSLDHQAAQLVKEAISRKAREGCTILISTQDSAFLSLIARNLILIDQGKVLAQDTVEELIRSPDPRIRRILEKFLQEAPAFDKDIFHLLNGDDSGDPFQ